MERVHSMMRKKERKMEKSEINPKSMRIEV